ncbi:hypothetical protein TSUD_341220 [Trifolium subterraneum]|uniref:MATH domain-containing protein n=1 Tax=Trifolium subterraneum TaxID=3900 RepID=A0A2Z6MHI5_TRISU|nr:hypothetical protein TSUD_341220 [Trifolium subterraneum]
MESQDSSTEIFEKFTWKIENFSRLNAEKICSEPFILCGYPWRILMFPKGYKKRGAVNHLSIYLEAVKTANMSEGWSRHVKIKLLVFNQLNSNRTITKENPHSYFSTKEGSWGFLYLMELTEFHDPEKGFIVNDACIVGAEVYVYNSSNEKKVNQVVLGPEPKGTNVETLSPVSKVICNESTKQAYAELVSAALGRVIYFLKTRKVKDMNDQACKDLQVLWDELEKFQFDLAWLEPHVKYALGVKSYVEKALESEKLKENMVVLQLEMERLKENMVVLELEIEKLKVKSIAAEVNLDVQRDLLKAKGFEKIDLNSQLGYGS